jgi:hypothetical protein
MKFLFTLFTVLLLSNLQSQSIEKITFKTQKDFMFSCENGKFCSSFSAGENPDQKALDNLTQYIQVNKTIMSSVQDASNILLTINGDKSERVVYQKIFYVLGVFQIEILEGDKKGIYYVDDFLNLYNL